MTFKPSNLKAGMVLLCCAYGLGLYHARAYQSDNGDGTFNNPVMYADYPDPDIVRVGSDFYMVSTTFVDSPGINVLHSKDLVNWEILSHVCTNLDGGNSYNMTGGTAYRAGFWASSIRYYNGTFYVVANPQFANSRIYYTTNAAGPWQYYQLNQVTYDPGLFIETNGIAYIVAGHGPESVYVLNSNLSQIIGVSNNVVNATGEGSHVVKRGSYYYVFTAYPGTWPYQLYCSRATNIFGPYETNHSVLTETAGGHQGGIVDMPDGSDYGFVMKDSGAVGRMTSICPITWSSSWPVWGSGGVPTKATKPIAGQTVMQPATSDDFANTTLGLQWQWNHNPDNTKWSLTARPGYLRLSPSLAANLWAARNTLTQKGQGPQSQGIVKFDVSNLKSGDIAGLGTLGTVNGQAYITADSAGNKTLGMTVDDRQHGSTNYAAGYPFYGTNLYLRVDLNFQSNLGTCSFSADGTTWNRLGPDFPLAYDISVGTFQGEKFAIFCYNTTTASSPGYVDVASFTFNPSFTPVTVQRARPRLNVAHTTFVGDNGQELRGPFTSTEWTGPVSAQNIASMKNLGFNAIHLYGESFNPNYPTNGSAPGYSLANIDAIVGETRTNGLYLVITIGNGAANGDYNRAYETNFWNLYGARYANETHVMYEIQNEPVAWGPSYLTSSSPPGAVDMEIACYSAIRANAPNTPVLLFTYAVFGGKGGADAAMTDIHAFNTSVFGNQNAVWTNEAVAFHGYNGWSGTSTAVSYLLGYGYPCVMTEYGTGAWGFTDNGVDAEMTSELERQNVSWLSFLHVPGSGVSSDVSLPQCYSNVVKYSGLGWTADYGTFPPLRGPYNNNGYARSIPASYNNNFLSGTPLRLQAEDFDTGGEGVAYHELTTNNLSGQYRLNEAVDIEVTTDTGGGYDVTSTAAGEWLEYTIMAPYAGYYNLSLRYAAPTDGCVVQATANGHDQTGSWLLPSTGSSSTWATVTKPILLVYGHQILHLNILNGGFNLNWMELTPVSTGLIPNGTYKFLNAANGMVPTAQTTTNLVVASNYLGSTYQQWNLQHVGGGQYKITAVANGFTWNVNNDRILTATSGWGTGDNRSYILSPTSGSFYSLLPVGNGVPVETSASNPRTVDENNGYSGGANQQWAIADPSAPMFPIGLSATAISATQVSLTWSAVAGATSYNLKRAISSGGPYTTFATGITGTSYTDTVPVGMKYYYVVTAVSSGAASPNSAEAIAGLPYPWMTQDVGTVNLTGSASLSSGVFTVTGAGADIWGTADAFRYVCVSVTGDCTMIARVTSVPHVDDWSKAGIMIRASLDANAMNAFIAVTPANGVTWQYRTSTGGNSGNSASGGVTAPYWVKLVRSGNAFTGYRSPDGVTWTQVGSTQTFSMASTVYIGLAVTSHNSSSLCAATFDNVTAPGWTNVASPQAPASLSAAVANWNVLLNWTPSANALSYNLKRALTYGGPYILLANLPTTGFTDTTVGSGTNYYYVVSALNAGGESANSPQTLVNAQAFAPSGLSATPVSTTQVSLIWSSFTNASSYNVKRSPVGGGPYAVVATGIVTTNYTDTVAAGMKYYYVVSATSGAVESLNSSETSINLPYPWQTQDVGNVVLSGSASYAGGMFTLVGAGDDIQSTADAFRFVYLPASGDGTIVARVASVPSTSVNAWAKAGVMMRESLNTGAGNILMAVTPGNGTTWQNRTTTGGTSGYGNQTGLTAPYWVKLTRAGNVFTAYDSPDGVNWTLRQTTTYAMASSYYVGLALTSHNTSSLGTATFDNVTAPGWPNAAPPASPASLAATAGNLAAALSWPAASGAASYNVKRSLSNGGPYTIITNVTTTSCTDSGLVIGTNYYYVVSALNLAGESANSAQASVTAQVLAPAGLSATAICGTQLSLVWNVFSNTATYNLKRSTTSGGSYAVIAGGLSATNYLDSGLARGTTYYYVVSAVVGGNETPNSTQATATTLLPFSGTWTNNLAGGTGNWSVAGNWNVGIPLGVGDSATLGIGSGLSTVRLDLNATLSSLTFTNPNSFVVADMGSMLTLDGSGSGARLNVTNGTANVIASAVSLNDNLSAYVSSGKSLSISGVVSNAGAAKTLTVNGPGTLALSGNNSYGPAAGSAGTTLSGGGTLQVGHNNALGRGDLSVTASGTIRAGATVSLSNNLALGAGATLTVDNNGYGLGLGGVLSGSGALTKTGAGILTLTSAASYAGDTTLNTGTLQCGAANLLPNGAGKGNVAVNVGGTLDLNGFDLGLNGLSGSGIVDNLSAATATLSVGNNNASSAFGGAIRSSGGAANLNLLKSGSGTLSLSGTNTFSGYVQVSGAGTLSVSSISNALGRVSSLILGGGSASGRLLYTGAGEATERILTFNATQAGASQVIDQSGSGLLKFTSDFAYTGSVSNVLTLQGSTSGAGEFAGNIGGGTGMALVKSGTGTWTLSGNNTYAGGTTLNGGRLNLASAAALGTGPFTNNASSASLDNTSGQTLMLANHNAQYWNGDLNFIGSSDLNLGSGPVVLDRGHQVAVANGTLTVGGGISIGGSGALTNAGPGSLVLLGTNNSMGDLWLLAGTFTVGDSGTLGGGGYNGVITDNALFNYASSAAQFVTNGIAGSGSLTVSGSGTLTLLGANSYSGGTLISSGSLRLGASASLASTPIITTPTATVMPGATLDVSAVTGGFTLGGGQWLSGGGSVAGDVTVADDFTAWVYPNGTWGQSWAHTNTLSFGGNLSFGPSSTLEFDLSSSSAGANDSICLTGAGAVLEGNGAGIWIFAPELEPRDYVLFRLSGEGATVASGFSSVPLWDVFEPAHSERYSIQTMGQTVVLHYEPFALTVTNLTVKSKPYDGTTAATLDVSGARLVGVNGGDVVGLDSSHYTANFASAGSSAGSTNVPVSVTGLGLSGPQALYYSLTQPTGLTGNILPGTVAGWPYITEVSFSGGTVTLMGTNVAGAAGHAYEVWSSPSLTAARSGWTPVTGSSNVFGPDGGFTSSFPAPASTQFYIIKAAP